MIFKISNKDKAINAISNIIKTREFKAFILIIIAALFSTGLAYVINFMSTSREYDSFVAENNGKLEKLTCNNGFLVVQYFVDKRDKNTKENIVRSVDGEPIVCGVATVKQDAPVEHYQPDYYQYNNKYYLTLSNLSASIKITPHGD
jgi:hypothetical protein